MRPTEDAGPAMDGASCTEDTDDDGVCDAIDVCPNVADPSQLDSDGDGIGWACDPVESFTFDAAIGTVYVGGSVSSNGFVAHWEGCNACEVVIASGDATSLWVSRSSSTDPADSWLNNGEHVVNVMVTGDHQLFASHLQNSGGEMHQLDPAAKTAEVRGSALTRWLRAGTGAPVVLSLSQSPSHGAQLVEARNGSQLQNIATVSQGLWFHTHDPYLNEDEWATEEEPLVANRIIGLPAPWTLQRFTPGTNALTELSPAVTGARELSRLGLGRGAPWCVLQGTTASLYVPLPSGMQVIALPFTDCGLQASQLGDRLVLVGRSAEVSGDGIMGWTAVVIHNGVAHTVFEDVQQQTSSVKAYGRDVIALVVRPLDTDKLSAVYGVWPDDSSALLASDLATVNVSPGIDTVHVIGIRSAGGTSGPLTVRRFKQGQAAQSADVYANVSVGFATNVITTAEGAAIASMGTYGWVSSSSSLTFTGDPSLGMVTGGVRRGHTVVFNTGPTAIGAVFAYDEVAGQPRLTRLTLDATGFRGALVDIGGAQDSEYFAFKPQCKFGRIRDGVGGVPTLETTACAFDSFAEVNVVEQTPLGETLVTDSAVGSMRLSALSEAGVRQIAHRFPVSPVFERSTNPPTLVAWFVRDNQKGYACVEESPQRCWTTPGDMLLLDSRIEPGVISMLLFAFEGVRQTFTVARTLGPGDATLP
jgi:hypothetical protein